MRIMRVVVGCSIFLSLAVGLLNAEYIIKTKKANMRKEPSTSSKIIAVLYQYESVKVLKVQGNWVKVRNIDGKVGWIHKSVLEKLEEEEPKKEIPQTPKEEASIITTSTLTIGKALVINENTQPIKEEVRIIRNEPVKEWTLKKDTSSEKRRRVIGEHIFPSTVLFPSPIPSARFGFSQGFLTLKGKYLAIEDENENGQIEEDEISTNKYNYAGLSEVFDAGIVVHNNLSFDLNAQIYLAGGMEKKDFMTIEATPQGDVRVGPIFSYKFENNLLISFSPRYYLSRGISVSAENGINGMINELEKKLNDPGFESFLEDLQNQLAAGEIDEVEYFFKIVNSSYVASVLPDAIKGFTQNIMVNTSRTALSPSLGFAYPVNKFLGLQGIVEYQKISETEKTKIETEKSKYNQLNYGLGVSVDLRHLISLPLGTTLEYYREKSKTDSSNSLALSVYYQGIGEIQLGLNLMLNKFEHKDHSYNDSNSRRLIQFQISYFF